MASDRLSWSAPTHLRACQCVPVWPSCFVRALPFKPPATSSCLLLGTSSSCGRNAPAASPSTANGSLRPAFRTSRDFRRGTPPARRPAQPRLPVPSGDAALRRRPGGRPPPLARNSSVASTRATASGASPRLLPSDKSTRRRPLARTTPFASDGAGGAPSLRRPFASVAWASSALPPAAPSSHAGVGRSRR